SCSWRRQTDRAMLRHLNRRKSHSLWTETAPERRLVGTSPIKVAKARASNQNRPRFFDALLKEGKAQVDWPKRVLVNLSGGIDSSYCLYLAMQAGCDVLVHHIRLVNREGRAPYEKEAVQRVMEWIRSQGLPGRIT